MSGDLSIKIFLPNKTIRASVTVPVSKSEVNRLLILQALSGGKIQLENSSTANDAKVIERVLSSNDTNIDVEDAGTAMRFLTAYFCAINEHKILRGTERMHERPVGELVDALRELGFNIRYVSEDRFPPVEILPVDFIKLKNETHISGNISSQFVSALMMIGAFLPNGLTVKIKDGTVSGNYIKLTAALLEKCGITATFFGNTISIKPQFIKQITVSAGGDWTNGSYWYAFAALCDSAELTIKNLQKETSQGDIAMIEIGKLFGVSTRFKKNTTILEKDSCFCGNDGLSGVNDALKFDFSNNPDLAQTIIVLCAALNREATFTGLQSLRIKETDRICALQNELKKAGVELYEKEADVFSLKGTFHAPAQSIKTYNDHRMAMAFAPLSLLCEIEIEDPDVVRKSYPEFWIEVAKLQ